MSLNCSTEILLDVLGKIS